MGGRDPAEPAGLSTAQLREIVAAAMGDLVELRVLGRLTGGASRETWSVDVETASGQTVPFIVRCDRAGDTGSSPMEREAMAFRSAARAGVPVPRILVYSDDDRALGAPFIVMERVEGETVPRRILRNEAFAAVRPRLGALCGEVLARIHAIPPSDIPGLESPDPITELSGLLDAFEDRSPALELGLRWLREHRSEPTPAAVVHGDFRNGNLVVTPAGIRAVLDWELVHCGDPMRDLGWLCVRAWRFGGEKPVGGFADYRDIFDAYERAGGRVVDPRAVHWWQLWGTVRWGVGCMQMAARHLDGRVRSVELAAIGRRLHEQEYDVLLLLDDIVSKEPA